MTFMKSSKRSYWKSWANFSTDLIWYSMTAKSSGQKSKPKLNMNLVEEQELV
jgi:hypothetical protein